MVAVVEVWEDAANVLNECSCDTRAIEPGKHVEKSPIKIQLSTWKGLGQCVSGKALKSSLSPSTKQGA